MSNKKSIFDMSDDEFDKLSEEELLEMAQKEEENTDDSSNEGSNENDNENIEEEETTEVNEETTEETVNNEEEGTDTTDTSDNSNEEEATEEDKDGNKEGSTLEELGDDINVDISKELLKPIKYKGTEVPINSIDELRELASKGLDYTKKTMELADDRRYIEALKEANLLDENTINLLIEVGKGKKEAIKKLLEVNKIDVDDLPFDEEDDTYIPENNVPSIDEVRIKQELDVIRGMVQQETYDKLFNEVDNSLDEQSKLHLFQNPHELRILASHMDTGVYDTVKAEIAKRTALGQINPNVPFLDLYQFIGTELEQRGVFKGNNNVNPDTTKANQQTVKTKAKRNSMAPTRSSKKKPTASYTLEELDNLSDKEFLEKFENFEI